MIGNRPWVRGGVGAPRVHLLPTARTTHVPSRIPVSRGDPTDELIGFVAAGAKPPAQPRRQQQSSPSMKI
jgi:hypothetical protein